MAITIEEDWSSDSQGVEDWSSDSQSVEDWSSDSEGVFAVTIHNYEIKTTVTEDPMTVDEWISEIYDTYQTDDRELIVGLDVEWRPNYGGYINPVATLQLCVGHHCLIYQLMYTPFIPDSLEEFLGDSDCCFVGVGIGRDVDKLMVDYNLAVENTVDLASLAAEEMGLRRNAGLKELAWEVFGWQVEKPRWVTMGRWDAELLSHDQIKYACLDAFLSSEIGEILLDVD
ncbi:hypothetical protein Dimus_002077 [Dionaea muscipula]